MTRLLVAGFVVFLLGGAGAWAQTIEIELVNGRSGKPVSDSWVNVGLPLWGKMLVVLTDEHGVARLGLTHKASEFDLHEHRTKRGGVGSTAPVVLYPETFSVNAPWASCQSREADFSWLARQGFVTSEVLEQGFVSKNVCGGPEQSPVPGKIVLYVRPLSFWEKLRE